MIAVQCDCGATPEQSKANITDPAAGSILADWDIYCPGCGKCVRLSMGTNGQLTMLLVEKHERNVQG